MSKQFLAILAAIVIVFIGIFALSNNHKSNSGSSNSSKLTNHVEGQNKNGITLVEYGDYQCPFCGQFYPVIKQVESQYDQQISFQFRNFPLTNLHPNAFAAARAAEAAAMQNKFWQMHDLLYEQNQIYYNSGEPSNSWIGSSNPLSYFDSDAQQLGLNVSKFNKDYSSDTVDSLVTADSNEGNKLGVNATPTFFLNGKQLQNAKESVSYFQDLINKEITKKTATH